MKLYKYILISIILIMLTSSLSSCKIVNKLEGQKNKKNMIKYAQKKYSSDLRITYQDLGSGDFLLGKQPDILILSNNNSSKPFPFKIEYIDGKIIDYYPSGYAGLLVKQDIEKKFFNKRNNLKYINSSKVIKVDCDINEIMPLSESLNEVINLNNKRVDFISVIECDTEPNLQDYEWLYYIYEDLCNISDRFYINISFVKPKYFNEFEKRFSEEYENNYDAEIYKNKFYFNFTAEIDTKINPIKTKDEFISRFIKF